MMEIWIVGWAITFAMAIYEHKIEGEMHPCLDKIPLWFLIFMSIVLFLTWPFNIYNIYKSLKGTINEKYLDKEIHSKDR